MPWAFLGLGVTLTSHVALAVELYVDTDSRLAYRAARGLFPMRRTLLSAIFLLLPICAAADTISFSKDRNAFVPNDAILWPQTGWTRITGNLYGVAGTTERGYTFTARFLSVSPFPPNGSGLLGDLTLNFLTPVRSVGFQTQDRSVCARPFVSCNIHASVTTTGGQDFGIGVRVFGPEYLAFTDVTRPNIASAFIFGTETNEPRLIDSLGDGILLEIPEPPSWTLLGIGLVAVLINDWLRRTSTVHSEHQRHSFARSRKS